MKKWTLLCLAIVLGLLCSMALPVPFGLTGAGGQDRGAVQKTYEVESSVDDDTFVINGHVFKAKTFCLNMREGDQVTFLEGRADGYCGTAVIVNVRTGERCEVLCEGR